MLVPAGAHVTALGARISNAHAECDRDCRRLQRTRLLTQSQRPQSASADQRRQHARDSRRPVTQPETKTCTRQVLTPDLSDITYGPWGATCLDHSVGELRRAPERLAGGW